MIRAPRLGRLGTSITITITNHHHHHHATVPATPYLSLSRRRRPLLIRRCDSASSSSPSPPSSPSSPSSPSRSPPSPSPSPSPSTSSSPPPAWGFANQSTWHDAWRRDATAQKEVSALFDDLVADQIPTAGGTVTDDDAGRGESDRVGRYSREELSDFLLLLTDLLGLDNPMRTVGMIRDHPGLVELTPAEVRSHKQITLTLTLAHTHTHLQLTHSYPHLASSAIFLSTIGLSGPTCLYFICLFIYLFHVVDHVPYSSYKVPVTPGQRHGYSPPPSFAPHRPRCGRGDGAGAANHVEIDARHTD